jgi:Tfp pilus assembly protein PilX
MSLMVTLWLSILLLLLGLAMLNRRADQHKAAQRVAESAMAYELAVAGLESARVRLAKDSSFPPRGADQTRFTCTEAVYDVDNTTVRGFYVLDIDTRWINKPYFLIKVTSMGCWPEPDKPMARRRLRAEMDLNPDPSHSTTFMRWVQWHDEGTL